MNEQPCRFAEDGRLCGVLTLPDATAPVRRPAVLFLSAGLLHKPGPYRLHVELARSLAADGFVGLRFDLSGIGDSLAATAAQSADEIAVDDVRAAMNFLEDEWGCERFVLFGLCSGAEIAQHAAVTDDRVDGIVALDGHLPLTAAYYFWHYLPRATSPRKWIDFIRGRLKRFSRDHIDTNAAVASIWRESPPARQALTADLRRLCERGIRQLYVFSGGSGLCSYANQFRDAFRDVDFQNVVDVRFLRQADHMYILRTDRRALQRTVCRWLATKFSAVMAPAGKRAVSRLRPAAKTASCNEAIPMNGSTRL